MQALPSSRTSFFLLLGLLLLAAMSRLPLFGEDRMILDGDEALMGMMSHYQLDKGETPWFFWGQRYGFSLMEVSAISLFQSFMGFNDLAVHFGILVIWLLALAGMFFFLKTLLNPYWAFVLVLLFAFHPVWFFWSIRARGGYLTALCASSWLFYFALKNGSVLFKGIICGALLALVYHSMRLWFPSSLLVIFGIFSFQDSRSKTALWTTAGFIAVFGILYIISLDYPDFWQPRVIDFELWKENIQKAPGRLRIFFEGNYILGDSFSVKNWTYVSYSILRILFVISLFLALLQWKERKDKIRQVSFLLAALIPLSILFISSEFFSPRYLLPFPFFFLLWASGQWVNLRSGKWLSILFVSLAILFLVGSWQLKQATLFTNLVKERNEKKEIAELLVADGYPFVLCESPGVPWQLMYYGKGKLISSWKSSKDRQQDFPRSIREAYSKGITVPVLSFHRQEHLGFAGDFKAYGGQFLLTKTSPLQLEKLGFDMRVFP